MKFKGFNFRRNDAFWRTLICITYTFSTWVISGSFLRYRMQVTEKRNFMDIFYINCFSHSLYLSRARNISCFLCFLTIVYAIYSRNCIHLRETAKQKCRVDTYKAKERKWGRMLRWCLDHWIYPIISGGSYNFLSFCFKETHTWFRADYFCISYGLEICPCRCGIPGIRNM